MNRGNIGCFTAYNKFSLMKLPRVCLKLFEVMNFTKMFRFFRSRNNKKSKKKL